MRPHGRARVDRSNPQAHATCDRCGARYLHKQLSWQVQWIGPRLQNIRILVCRTCLDKPQELLRTIVLPPDPVPIANPRPELYVSDDNPMQTVGWSAGHMLTIIPSTLGMNFGNLTLLGGVDAAFNGVANKPFGQCAALLNSVSSYQNVVGKNWGGGLTGITTPSSLADPVQTHIVSSFTMYAPNDKPFLGSGATGFLFQGSNDGGTWTTLYSGTTVGSIGETVTSASSSLTATAPYQYHRLAINGDGISPVAIAQLAISISDGSNAEVA